MKLNQLNLFVTSLLGFVGEDGIWTRLVKLSKDFLSSMVGPAAMIAGGVCVLFGIFLAIRHAMSKGDESKVKESKEAWKNFIIGCIGIFVVIVGVPALFSALISWIGQNDTEITAMLPYINVITSL